jgi:hypothetical protein
MGEHKTIQSGNYVSIIEWELAGHISRNLSQECEDGVKNNPVRLSKEAYIFQHPNIKSEMHPDKKSYQLDNCFLVIEGNTTLNHELYIL